MRRGVPECGKTNCAVLYSAGVTLPYVILHMQAIVYEFHLLPLNMLKSICKPHLQQDVGCLHKGVVGLDFILRPKSVV